MPNSTLLVFPNTLLKRAETPILWQVNVLPTAALVVLPDVQRTHRPAAAAEE